MDSPGHRDRCCDTTASDTWAEEPVSPGISMDMALFPDSDIAISAMTNRTGYDASEIIQMALHVTLTMLGQA